MSPTTTSTGSVEIDVDVSNDNLGGKDVEIRLVEATNDCTENCVNGKIPITFTPSTQLVSKELAAGGNSVTYKFYVQRNSGSTAEGTVTFRATISSCGPDCGTYDKRPPGGKLSGSLTFDE